MRPFALFALLALACNGKVASDSDPVPPISSETPANPRPVDASAPRVGRCQVDVDCNAGTCFDGLCSCREGFFVQADGRCGKEAPTSCDGSCRSGAPCEDGELADERTANFVCGDFVAAYCCHPTASCTGPISGVTLACCSKSGGREVPICVRGWQTCRAGTTPVASGSACN